MKCEKCNKREATTHLTKIVNGYKEEHHLCSECAANSPEYKQMESSMNFGIGDFLTGMFSSPKKQPTIGGDIESGVCPTCGMPYSEFLSTGKLGCGDCYGTFRNRLERPLRQIHGTAEHIGKAPVRGGGEVMLDKKITKLESELNAAVLRQDFETAARLRDEIKDLKNNAKEA